MIIQLGDMQFNVTFGYNAISWALDWDWAEIPIFENHPALQFTGKTRELNFDGVYWNYTAEGDATEALEQIADEAKPLSLTDDLGNFYGFFVVTSLKKNEEHFL